MNRFDHLTLDLDVHRNVRVVSQPTGVDEPELSPVPVRAGEMTISGRAGLVADDCAVLADNTIEESGFADVRATNDCYYRNIHAATASSSVVRTSTKS